MMCALMARGSLPWGTALSGWVVRQATSATALHVGGPVATGRGTRTCI